MPWLQDVAGQDVRAAWEARDRDVFILDSMNRVFAVYNLYEHDLTVAANRDELMALFLEAAAWKDQDEDTLSDDWEQLHFDGLAGGPSDDPDQDGADNFTEYVFGSHPLDGTSRPVFRTATVEEEFERFLTVSFNLRMGAQIRSVMETSPDAAVWNTWEELFILEEPLRNRFDGTGTQRVTVRLTTPMGLGRNAFFRVRGLPGSGVP